MSPPSPWRRITWALSRETRNEPRGMTLCWRSQSWAVVSSRAADLDRPALLTTRSRPPKARTPAAVPALMAASSATSIATPTATSGPPSSLANASAPARSRSATITHAPWAARAWQVARPIPEPPPGDQGDPAGQRLGLGHPLELGLLQGPVLDPELLGLVHRLVDRDGLGPAHHIDRVHVELARH